VNGLVLSDDGSGEVALSWFTDETALSVFRSAEKGSRIFDVV